MRVDVVPSTAEDALRTATEPDFVEAWTDTVGQPPACLLEREVMITILRETEGVGAIAQAAELLVGHS